VPGGLEPIVTERGAGWAKLVTGATRANGRSFTINRQREYFLGHMTPPPSGAKCKSDSWRDEMYKQWPETVNPYWTDFNFGELKSPVIEN